MDTNQRTSGHQHEPLLDVFKAAALSVTKLYKTAATAETKARNDGYQECLDELLAFLDKEKLGLGDGEGWRVRGWATERLDGRESLQPNSDSDEEGERPDTRSSSEATARASIERQAAPALPAMVSITEEPKPFVVPTAEAFTFQSAYPNIATLDLSDASVQQATSASTPAVSSSTSSTSSSSASAMPRASKSRLHNLSRSNSRPSVTLGRGAGSKRRMDVNDFFPGLFGKDSCGNGGGKRSRHL